MVAQSPILTAPPHAVEQSLRTLGANLRTARLRRGLTLQAVADKLGVARHTVAAAEAGRPATAAAVYAGLLWCFQMEGDLANLADPATDRTGLVLERARAPKRAPRQRAADSDLSDDF
jgi:transcriptional regulator with XRE-family HTH domain